MKKLLVAVAALSLALVGCAPEQSSQTVSPVAPVNQCLVGAPSWVLIGSAEGGLSAVGQAKIGKAGLSFARTEATAGGRDELARIMSVKVQNMVKNFTQVTGIGDAETVDKVSSQVSKQVANQTLAGSKMANSWVSPCNDLYVLVALDPNSVKQTVKESTVSSLKNEQALWQQFQAKKAQDELAAEIDKQFTPAPAQ